MKKLLFVSFLFISASAFAQSKPVAKKDSVFAKKDSVIQPTAFTPLLSYYDIKFLQDSVLQNAPYKYAPVLDQVIQWLTTRVQQKASEYIAAQKKK